MGGRGEASVHQDGRSEFNQDGCSVADCPGRPAGLRLGPGGAAVGAAQRGPSPPFPANQLFLALALLTPWLVGGLGLVWAISQLSLGLLVPLAGYAAGMVLGRQKVGL